MEHEINEPFEDVFPIENGDVPASYVSLPEGKTFIFPWDFLGPQGVGKL